MDIKIYYKVKYYIILIKNGADFTMSSAQGECLPLPHTNATKPAPSTLKVLVYLKQVKKNIIRNI